MRTATLSLAIAAACAQPVAPPPEEGPSRPPGPVAPVCNDVPAGERVAQFAGDPCPWVLLAERDRLRLTSLDLSPPADAFGPPPVCLHASCRYEGVHTPLGPMVIATEPTAESEVPRTVFLGVVVKKNEIAFYDLWAAAGPAVVEDSTELGPAHALQPMQCGKNLGLFARARLPIGETVEPPPELRTREGIVELALSPATREGKHDGCVPLDLPLP